MTAQGHPRAIFKRAIKNGNVLVAEMTARELGRLSLAEALALTALVVQKDPTRRSRYAVRWLRRLLEEDKLLTIEEATLAASALAALGGRGSDEALTTLSTMAERVTREREGSLPRPRKSAGAGVRPGDYPLSQSPASDCGPPLQEGTRPPLTRDQARPARLSQRQIVVRLTS